MIAYLRRFIDWCRERLGWNTRDSAEPQPQPEPQPQSEPRPERPRRKIAATLSDLLDKVEEAFESIQLPDREWNMVERRVRTGLRRMGPWVPFGAPWDDDSKNREPTIAAEYRKKWPALIFLSRGNVSEFKDGFDTEKGKYEVLAFAYAEKFAKHPWYVEQKHGVSYEFGMAYRREKRLHWVAMHLIIDETSGAITVCRHLCTRQCFLDKGKNKGLGYPVKEWADPVTEEATTWGKTKEERERGAAVQFAQVFEWWQRRSERWSVSVRRGKQRVTWSVEQSLTKDFFKDRDKTALTPSGHRKRIIHFVNAHTRLLRDGKSVAVKEHIRGLRVFSWRGFECAITAPEFHRFALQDFDLGGYSLDDMPPTEKGIALDVIGERLAEYEDSQDYRALEQMTRAPKGPSKSAPRAA